MSHRDHGRDDGGASGGAINDGIAPPVGAPPRTLSDIPGLGPIRVRALQKAGWTSLSDLRAADLATLLTVPGLTEVKARHIQSYLQPYGPEDLVALPEAAQPVPEASNGKSTLTLAVPTESAAGAPQVVQRATRAMGEVITVLLSPEAPNFRSRFLRILGLFAQCAESIATDAAHLSPEQQARAIRRLRRAGKALSELTASDAGDKKAQGKAADTLEELTAKLAECRLSN